MSHGHPIEESAANAPQTIDRSKSRRFAAFVNLPPPVIYAITIVVTNAFSFFTVPYLAAHVPPEEYGRFDIAVSLVEAVILIAGLGVGAQLVRFASTADTEEGAQRVARELLGTCVVMAVIFTIVVQLLADDFAAALDLDIDMLALRMQLIAGCTTALVQMPMMWIRLKDRAWAYFTVGVLQTVIGVALMVVALQSGYGVAGVMITNASVLIVAAIILAVLQARETGISISRERFVQVAVYGAPIVGAMLAMFALGNSNRLFMSGEVSDAEIAHFGLAQRFAVAMALLYAPFDLWWNPKRIAILKEKDGLARSAEFWGLGVAILLLSSGAITLLAPIFIELVLDDGYDGASDYVPALVASTALLLIVTLSNVGAFAKDTGFYVLWVDCAGAAIAVVGYLFLIPTYGAPGALAAMFVGNFVRLGLYLAIGRKNAPIAYPWGRVILGAAATALIVWLAPPEEDWALRFLWSVFAGLGLLAFMFALRLLRPIEEPVWNTVKAMWHVRRS